MSADPYSVTGYIVLGFQSGRLANIGHMIYLIFFSVFPCNFSGKYDAVFSEIRFDGIILPGGLVVVSLLKNVVYTYSDEDKENYYNN